MGGKGSGGRRKGAGRKPANPEAVLVTKAVRLGPEELQTIASAQAKERLPTLSAAVRFIVRDWSERGR